MTNIHRRYYQFTEKETHTISLKWKVTHTTIFLLIAINSFLASFASQNIFNMFHHRCVLYANPAFYLTNIQYHEPRPEIIDQNNATEETFPQISTEDVNNSTDTVNDVNRTDVDLTTSGSSKVEAKGDSFWFNNATLGGTVVIDLRKTIYSSHVMCDMVVFNTLISMVLAMFFTAIVIICGRGGRGFISDTLPQSWLYVYPVLIVSSAMTVVSITTANTVITGLRGFCSGFEEFTGEPSCSYLVTHFSLQPGVLKSEFNRLYQLCVYTFYLEIALWVLQLIVTVLRILCVVDFQLNTVIVKSNKNDDGETVHEVLVKSFPGLTEDKAFVSKEEADRRFKEETTQL